MFTYVYKSILHFDLSYWRKNPGIILDFGRENGLEVETSKKMNIF
jgi:hypothetical protein